jgi:trimethylamine:corrinoid methyltransferase-like protein
MAPVTVTALTKPTAERLAGVAEVFDQYRRHYGQPVVAGQKLAWLSDHTSHGPWLRRR